MAHLEILEICFPYQQAVFPFHTTSHSNPGWFFFPIPLSWNCCVQCVEWVRRTMRPLAKLQPQTSKTPSFSLLLSLIYFYCLCSFSFVFFWWNKQGSCNGDVKGEGEENIKLVKFISFPQRILCARMKSRSSLEGWNNEKMQRAHICPPRITIRIAGWSRVKKRVCEIIETFVNNLKMNSRH